MEEYSTVVLAAGAAIGVLIVVTALVKAVRRRARRRALEAPLPLIPVASGRVAPPPPPHRLRTTVPFGQRSVDPAASPAAPFGPAAGDTNGRAGEHTRFAPPANVADREMANANVQLEAHQAGSVSSSVATGGRESALAETAVPLDHASGAAVDGASVRFWRPADGTLQFLPGRLEIIAGRDAGQEIRFVRTPGPDGSRVTFGRAEGAPYRHIQLREPTVSRAHARMTLETGATGGTDPRAAASPGWRLENLSATNPVVVNGRALAADGSDGCSVALSDGDRIEMGEVVFRFHAK